MQNILKRQHRYEMQAYACIDTLERQKQAVT